MCIRDSHPRYLNVLVFVAGFVTLGVELSAARLLDPWFGNSIVVWAGLIGNDTFAPLRALMSGTSRTSTSHRTPRRMPRSRAYRAPRPAMPTRTGPPTAAGRWSLLPELEPDPTVRAHATADQLLDAAEIAGEEFWQLPITAQIRSQLASEVADLYSTALKVLVGRRAKRHLEALVLVARQRDACLEVPVALRGHVVDEAARHAVEDPCHVADAGAEIGGHEQAHEERARRVVLHFLAGFRHAAGVGRRQPA